MTDWIEASTRLPKADEAGGFGTVEVILQCHSSTASSMDGVQVMRFARPVFIGGDPDRVLWLSMEDKSNSPIENSAWFVTHWRPFPKFPKPLPKKEQANG